MAVLPILALLAASPALPAETAMTKLLPTVEGWKLSGEPALYSPENLFEYIDGGADAYLQFDFEELLAATYKGPDKAELSVDIYRHKNAMRAFGMYTQERPAGSAPIPVGADGHGGSDHLEFVVGAYYVKLAQTGGKAPSVLRPFAEKLSAKLPGAHEPPATLACFPEQGKLSRAEKLAARDFLGHGFLHDAIAVPYQTGGAQFRLFVVAARDESDARGMIEHYCALAKATCSAIGKQGHLVLRDPLNG